MTSNLPMILATLNSLPARFRAGLRRAMSRGLQITSGVAQRDYMSGPRPSRLAVVTGRLRSSIATTVDATESDRLIGRIGTIIPYGSFHEFGFQGEELVGAHFRVTSEQGVKRGRLGLWSVGAVDSRRAIRERGTGRIVGYKESRLVASQRRLTLAQGGWVRAHTRKLNYPGRPYLLPAIETTKDQYGPIAIEELTTIEHTHRK